MATIKIPSLKKSTILILILITMTSNIFSQLREDLRNEILVYIQTSELEFPENEQKSIRLENIIFLNPELRTVLIQLGIQEIQKAFPNIKDADTLAISEDGAVIRIPQMSRIFAIKVPDVNDINSAIDNLSRIRGVLFAEKHSNISLTTDDYYPNQWHLNNTGQTGGTPDADIDAPEAWQIFNGSAGVKLGVIDTGVEISHDDLTGKSTGDLPESFPYDGYAHGTHVAGISAAKHNNIGKVRGVDANVQVLSKKVFSGYVYNYNCACYRPAWAGDNNAYNKIVEAINEGSNVFNNSYGGPDFSITLRMAFSYAYKMNRTAVVAMGNNNSSIPSYPAAFGQGIIAVGSTTHNDVRSTFSNFGSHIDVTAPGSSILSTWRGNGYDLASGTSMAAPVVAGIASLLKGYNPNLYNDDIEQIIRISADDKGDPGWDQYYGTGRVNAYKALQLLQAPYQLSQLSASGGTDYSSTNHYQQVFYGTTGLADGVYIVKRHEVRKNVSFPMHFDHNVWGRGVGTNGLSAANPNFGMGYCDVVEGSVSSNSATLRTYVYEVWSISGQWIGWRPTTPQNVSFNYTVLGKPAPLTASMSGPTYLSGGQTGTFIVTASGGTPPYSYSWSYYIYCRDEEEVKFSANKEPILPDAPVCGYWIPISNSTNTVTKTSDGRSFQMKCVVTDAANNTVTVTKYVQGNLSKTTLPDSLLTVNDLSEMKTELLDNYPNPFNPTTQINYSIKEAGLVQLKIYDILGKEIATLVNENKEAGNYSVDFNAFELPSGVYIYQLTTSGFTQARKMILAK